MESEQIVVSLTRLEEQIIAIRKEIKDRHDTEDRNHSEILRIIRDTDRRITSLEHSRTKIKTVIGLIATGLLFVGWESGAEWINHLLK